MAHTRKRPFNAPRSKRPVQRTATVVNFGGIQQIVTGSIIATADGPVTITGWRWKFEWNADGGTDTAERTIFVGIWVDRENTANPVVSFTDVFPVVVPIEKCIAFTYATFNSTEIINGAINHWEGTSKTMRKLKDGDAIIVIAANTSDANTSRIFGYVQVFAKH